jgi:hypothetical protein
MHPTAGFEALNRRDLRTVVHDGQRQTGVDTQQYLPPTPQPSPATTVGTSTTTRPPVTCCSRLVTPRHHRSPLATTWQPTRSKSSGPEALLMRPHGSGRTRSLVRDGGLRPNLFRPNDVGQVRRGQRGGQEPIVVGMVIDAWPLSEERRREMKGPAAQCVWHDLWHCPLALIAIATVKQFIELGRDLVVTWHTRARRISGISRILLKHNESGSSQRRRPTQPKLS